MKSKTNVVILLLSISLTTGCVTDSDFKRLEYQVGQIDRGNVKNSEMLRAEIVKLRGELSRISSIINDIKGKTDTICKQSQDGVDMIMPC